MKASIHVLLLSVVFFATAAQAGDGIVRWQDEKGNWHFSNHAVVDPSKKPKAVEKPKADMGLLNPGSLVVQSPESLQNWLIALKKQALVLGLVEGKDYVAKVNWPTAPVSWPVTVQEVVNKDFLNPDRGDLQVRARTQGMKNLPVAFDTKGLRGAAGIQRDQKMTVQGPLLLNAEVLDSMDQYGYLYRPIVVKASSVQVTQK